MEFEELETIKKELQCYKRDRRDVLMFNIQDRLNRSFETYYKELTNSFKYIINQNDLKILKNIK